ncbi:MAG: 2-keto-4-pentenoate hydratase [Actinomycetia bacterium]|nr:2-keto-4-pentenoate hydratase [Actinomycetes bacterium]
MSMATPTTDHELEEQIAAELRAAEESASPIEPFAARLGEDDVERAYRVQHLNTAFALSAGRTLRGRKIGLTAEAVQQQLGVDEPDYGALFADMRIPDGGSVDAAMLISPRIEAELALVVGTGISEPDLPLDELAACVSYAVPALEIVDSRLRDWRIGIVDTIADNGASARFVLGENHHAVDGLDLSSCGMELFRNGELVSSGQASATMGGPLQALRWLVDTLVRHDLPLGPGDVVLTGALGPVIAMAPGDRFQAHFDPLSSVSLNVEEPRS